MKDYNILRYLVSDYIVKDSKHHSMLDLKVKECLIGSLTRTELDELVSSGSKRRGYNIISLSVKDKDKKLVLRKLKKVHINKDFKYHSKKQKDDVVSLVFSHYTKEEVYYSEFLYSDYGKTWFLFTGTHELKLLLEFYQKYEYKIEKELGDLYEEAEYV